MWWKHPKWEETDGVRVMRVCGDGREDHGDDETADHWPRIAILDLSAEQYKQFRDNPMQFTVNHNIYSEQPIRWMCDCATPPAGEGIPVPCPDSRWTVIIFHGRPSVAACAGGSQCYIAD